MAALALLLAPAAGAADSAPAPGTTGSSGLQPFTPVTGEARLTEGAVLALFLDSPKVANWLDRYPPSPQSEATFDQGTRRWTVKVWSGRAGQIAAGKVQDGDGTVSEAWTGPQVAWGMARGRVGSFGGNVLNAWWTWTGLSLLFFLGLVDRRRLRSWHTLDLLALLSFGLSLLFFNRGQIFMSASLGAIPLGYLLVRMCWIGFRGRSTRPVLSWPVWIIAVAAIFLVGFRVGLNLEHPRGVIDVGLAGVIGGDRILDGRSPYGNMPIDHTGPLVWPAGQRGGDP